MSRALVLGGGGPVGIAWELALLTGLAEGGVDLSSADHILGTSAGAFVGSQIALGRDLAKMTAAILREAETPRPVPTPPPGAPDVIGMLARTRRSVAEGRDPAEARREIGAFALAAQTISEEMFIRGFGRGLSEAPQDVWPAGDFACTAVDAESGEFVVWNRTSGVRIARAVASSCSVPGVFPPITIGARRYVDGGVRSATNADLATNHELVVVVAVRPDDGEGTLEAELAVLRQGGARVELIAPDTASGAAFGPNLLDPATRPATAKAGLAQGRRLVERLGKVWG